MVTPHYYILEVLRVRAQFSCCLVEDFSVLIMFTWFDAGEMGG